MGKRYTKNRKGCRKEDLETKENKNLLQNAIKEMEEEITEENTETKYLSNVEEKKEIIETSESTTEETIEETPITEEKTLDKITDALTVEETEEQTEEKKENARNTAEQIAEKYKDTETFSMKDIIYLMKNSGLSYKQISQRMKQIADATEEYAKTQGPDFDRKEFLKKQMEEKLGKKK